MAYLSSLSATCAASDLLSCVQGVPETRAGLRGITGNLDRRQNRQEEEATKTEEKDCGGSVFGTAAWTTQITGDTRMKTFSSPRVFNKCHLTLGEALAALPDLEE